MTVAELIEKLKQLPPDYTVIVFDHWYHRHEPAEDITIWGGDSVEIVGR